jgi:hypothetical protein
MSAGIFALVFHFTMTISYAGPVSIPAIPSFRYIYPFFQQSWNLFVPTPVSNYRLFVEFDCDSLHRFDLFGKIVTAHSENRLKGYEPVLISFSNSLHYFEHTTPLKEPLNGPVSADPYFKMIEYSARNYLRQTYHCGIDTLKIILVVEPLHESPRVYFN